MIYKINIYYMSRIARYKNFYEDGIFDDEGEPEEDIEHDGGMPFTGPLKVDDKALLKRMNMLHCLMNTWQIPAADYVAYLQRFILRPKEEEKFNGNF